MIGAIPPLSSAPKIDVPSVLTMPSSILMTTPGFGSTVSKCVEKKIGGARDQLRAWLLQFQDEFFHVRLPFRDGEPDAQMPEHFVRAGCFRAKRAVEFAAFRIRTIDARPISS